MKEVFRTSTKGAIYSEVIALESEHLTYITAVCGSGRFLNKWEIWVFPARTHIKRYKGAYGPEDLVHIAPVAVLKGTGGHVRGKGHHSKGGYRAARVEAYKAIRPADLESAHQRKIDFPDGLSIINPPGVLEILGFSERSFIQEWAGFQAALVEAAALRAAADKAQRDVFENAQSRAQELVLSTGIPGASTGNISVEKRTFGLFSDTVEITQITLDCEAETLKAAVTSMAVFGEVSAKWPLETEMDLVQVHSSYGPYQTLVHVGKAIKSGGYTRAQELSRQTVSM